MGIFSLVRGKMAAAKAYKRSFVQAGAERRADILESEAKHAKELGKTLKRQEAARAEIAKTRELKHARAKKIIRGIGKKVQEHKKTHPGPQIGLGPSKGKSPPSFW